jgi:5'-nucleotidase
MTVNRFRFVLTSLVTMLALVAAPGAAANDNGEFQLTLLHNNDGESKLATGDSTPGYGGAARFATVVERLRAEAEASKLAARRGTLLVSSGDNFLAVWRFCMGSRPGRRGPTRSSPASWATTR